MKKLILLLTQLFCHHKYQYTEINHDGLNTMECKWCGKKKVVKVLSLLALAFVMCGCNEKEPQILKDNIVNINGWECKVIEIDGCEYIQGGYLLSHKGNCKYCAERRKKEQEELIRRLKEE